jgi:hypothetical protein
MSHERDAIFNKRRELIEAWSKYCGPAEAKVIAIASRRSRS